MDTSNFRLLQLHHFQPPAIDSESNACGALTESEPIDAKARLVLIRKLLSTMEEEWGEMKQWPAKVSSGCCDVEHEGSARVQKWEAEVVKFIERGERLVDAVGTVLEGGALPDINDYCDLNSLCVAINRGVMALQYQYEAIWDYQRHI